jgi:hypothetical protein
MTKRKIELTYSQMDKLVCEELQEVYKEFLPEKRPSCGMYSSNLEEDLKEMRKTRKALKRILDWYGVDND